MPEADTPPAPGVDPAALAATAELLSVMAHPARLAVLLLLDRDGPRTVSDLVEALALEQSAVSHHLRLLRDAALVASVPVGRHRIYRLADEHVVRILRDALAHAAEGRADPAADPAPQ